MEWLKDYETIPINEHRWIVFYTHTSETPYMVEQSLNRIGLEVAIIQETELAGVQVPEPLNAYMKPFYGLVEPKILDLTPASLKANLQSPALVVSEQPIPWALEAAFDASETVVGDEVIPVQFFKDHEKIPRGSSWYMTTASWSTRAPSMSKVSSVLNGLGIIAYQPPQFANSANPNLLSFLLSPGATANGVTVAQIRDALGAVTLFINSYASKSDIGFLREYEGTGADFIKAVAEFGGETAELATQITETGKNLIKVGRNALEVTDILLWVAVPAGISLLGYWGYKKVKGN